MPITYPPAPVQLSGDIETISRFLNSPTLILRRLRELVEQRFISDAILTGRYQVSGGGIIYEQSETIFADRVPLGIDPGGEYPMSGISTGAAAAAATVKWGEDALVFDEAIKRLNNDPVNRALVKLVNIMVKTVDSVSLSAIASIITLTQSASGTGAAYPGGSWANSTTVAMILRDILLAKAQIVALNQGYDPDTLVCDDLMFAILMSDLTVTNALRRETPDSPVYTGTLPEIGNLRVLPTSNMPAGNRDAWVLDSKMLGGMADEQLGGPGYTGAVQGVEAKTMRKDEQDGWRLRARRVTVPVIIETQAICKITHAIGT
jgi:hypothetical protein